MNVLSVHPGGDVLLELPANSAANEIDLSYFIADEWGVEAAEAGVLRLTVRVEEANTIPDARNDVVHTQVGQRISVDVLANDVDGDNDVLSIGEQAVLVAGEPGGLVETSSDGVFTFEPQTAGTFIFRYAATDRSAPDEAFIRVEVSPDSGNRPPIAVRDDVTLALGETRLVRALDNDGDPDGELFGVVEVIGDPNLDVVNEPGVGFFVTMDPGANVVETFQYRISDGPNDSELAFVVVTRSDVQFVDAAPVANDDSARVRADQTSRLFPLRNDFDPEGGRLEITDATSSSENVVASVGGNGQWVEVTVPPGEVFPFTVQYVVSDVGGNSDAANIETLIVPEGEPNQSPTARRDTAITREEVSVLVPVLANDDDPESDSISLQAIATDPGNGSAVVDPVEEQVTYTPDPGFRGTDSFSYVISDSQGDESVGFVQVAVMREPSSNTAPVATDDPDFEVQAGTADGPLDVLINDFDPDGDEFTIIDVTGDATIAPSGQTLRYTPPAELAEEQTVGLRYTISDSGGLTDTADVTITVLPNFVPIPPIPPIAIADVAGPFREGDPVIVPVLNNDLDEDGNVADLDVTTAAAGVTVNADGSLSLTAPAETFRFEYTVTDVDGLSDSATVEVQVEPNLPPVIQPDIDLGEFFNDESITVNLVDFVTDPEGDPLVFSSVSAEPGGNTTFDPGQPDQRVVIFQPGTEFRGQSGFSFAVEDLSLIHISEPTRPY